jgi:uncharacterized protein (DUF302 family)
MQQCLKGQFEEAIYEHPIKSIQTYRNTYKLIQEMVGKNGMRVAWILEQNY